MKIVMLVSRFPFPLEKGDKLRAYQHLEALHDLGYEIHLMALSDTLVKEEWIPPVRKLVSSLQVFRLRRSGIAWNLVKALVKGWPFQAGYFYSEAIRNCIKQSVLKLKPDIVYCQLIRTAAYADDGSGYKAILDYQDAFSKNALQRMKLSPVLLKPVFSRESRLTSKFERMCYDWFNEHLIISEQDRMELPVEIQPGIHVVPNSIDVNYFRPSEVEKEYDVTFVGNMKYPPNVDGARFLVEEIMPIVWKHIPDARVQIAGANPSKKVRELASPQVTVTGWVDDIRSCYLSSRVFAAPMRTGTGLQNKLLEAMAMGIPSIATSISAGPLHVTHGTHIMVGNTADELARCIVSLLRDHSLQKKLSAEARAFVKENFSPGKIRLLLKQIFEGRNDIK